MMEKVPLTTTLSHLTAMTQAILAVYCSYFITGKWYIRMSYSLLTSCG